MVIKPQAYDIHFSTRPEERTLAERLGDAFDITYGDRLADCSIWFVDPQVHTRERFGFRHEVLVIVSQQTKTDSRIFRIIRDINARYRHRLDPVLVLLIHGADPVAIRDLLRTDPERVIVPITVNELFGASEGSLSVRRRIAEYLGNTDLFDMASPITSDKYFFGRDALVQELVVRSTSRGEHSGVFGLRKTGKTSVLNAVVRRVSKGPVLAEYIDCHSPGVHGARWWQALQNIVDRLQNKLFNEHRRSARVQLEYTQANAATRFISDIRSILRDGNLERVVLLLDEIEFITPEISGPLGQHWSKDFVPFWQTIRSTSQETGGRLVFIVAGVNPLCVRKPRFADTPNPIFLLAPPRFLAPFERDDVKNMIQFIGRYSGVRFEEDVYGYLREKYGGHPFLIRLACSEVWQGVVAADPDRHVAVSIDDFKGRETEIRNRHTQSIKDILLSLVWFYPQEYEVLQVLALGDASAVERYKQDHPDFLTNFEQYGILKDDSTVAFAIEDLRTFIEQHGDEYEQEISPFRSSDLPPEILPEVPDLEKLSRLYQKRVEVEARLRRVLFMYLGVSTDFKPKKLAAAIIQGLHKRPDRPDPSALFIAQAPREVMEQLYLTDLKTIVLAHWKEFAPLFDGNKARFEMIMDDINIARKADAHLHNITDDQVEHFNASYGWMLHKLSQVPLV